MARLEENERMRIRKLRLQGLINDNTDDDYFYSFNSKNRHLYTSNSLPTSSYVRLSKK